MDTGGTYEVIFDMSHAPFSGWWFGMLGFVICLMFFAFSRFAEQPRIRQASLLLAVAVAALSVVSTVSLWNEYSALRDAYLANRTEHVEGPVEQFQPDNMVQKLPETFSVQGENFQLNPSVVTSAFNRTVESGGPNLAGRCARVVYVRQPSGNKIVWLGVQRSC